MRLMLLWPILLVTACLGGDPYYEEAESEAIAAPCNTRTFPSSTVGWINEGAARRDAERQLEADCDAIGCGYDASTITTYRFKGTWGARGTIYVPAELAYHGRCADRPVADTR